VVARTGRPILAAVAEIAVMMRARVSSTPLPVMAWEMPLMDTSPVPSSAICAVILGKAGIFAWSVGGLLMGSAFPLSPA
jgi:hypothetical protein